MLSSPVVAEEEAYPALKAALAGTRTEVAAGADALIEAAKRDVDWTMAAIVGCAGLPPTMAAIEQGRTVALANKEALVSAGDLMMAAVERSGATLLPVDSEHNAIFQCLAGGQIDQVRKITLTASGGPFRTSRSTRCAPSPPHKPSRIPIGTWARKSASIRRR